MTVRLVHRGFRFPQAIGLDDKWVGVVGKKVPGIPYPTDPLPGGIQTSTTVLQVPTPGAKAPWPYDPCTYKPNAPAAWPSAESPGSYYIDSTSAASTDTNNTYGYPNKPRKTLPNTFTLNEGAYVEFHGNATYSFSNTNWTCAGSGSAPAYIVCTGGAKLDTSQAGWNFTGQHVIFDTCHLVGDARPRINFNTFKYGTIRDCTFEGTGGAVGGQGIFISGSSNENRSEYFMILRNTALKMGVFPKQSSQDCHFIQPHWWCNHIWVMGNTAPLNAINADFIQCANSYRSVPDHTTPAIYPHYVFIGANDVAGCGEQAVDCKGSYHVIVSSNKFWWQDTNYFGEPTGTADVDNVTLSNNQEADFSGPKWLLFNEIFNQTYGVLARDSGTYNDDRLFMIGNVLHTGVVGIRTQFGGQIPSGGPGIDTLTRPRNLYVVHNTIDNVAYGYNCNQCSDPSNYFLELYGNLFTNTINAAIWFDSTENNTVNKNLYWNAAGAVTILDDNGHTFQPGYDPASELYNVDPKYVDYVNHDYRLQADSPAKGFSAEHAVYQLFEDWYGLDIRVDKTGTPRPQGAWSSGAYEAQAA